MAQNLVEKLVQKYAVGVEVGKEVHSGDYVSIRPAHVLTHDNTAAVMRKFRAIGATGMADPRQPVFVLDHNVHDRSRANLQKYADIERFAAA
ncbi:MAG: homoaconitase, partial [Acidobacteriota bacterium]